MDADPRELLAVLGGSFTALSLTFGIGLWLLGSQFENLHWVALGKKISTFTIVAILLLVVVWFLMG